MIEFLLVWFVVGTLVALLVAPWLKEKASR